MLEEVELLFKFACGRFDEGIDKDEVFWEVLVDGFRFGSLSNLEGCLSNTSCIPREIAFEGGEEDTAVPFLEEDRFDGNGLEASYLLKISWLPCEA